MQPIYPGDAEAGEVLSLVILEITVDRAASVSNVQPLCGADIVVPAGGQWRYAPTLPIDYTTSADRFSKRVAIPDILEVASRMRAGSDLMSAVGMNLWSNRIFYGDTFLYRYEDAKLGEAWDRSSRQSNHKTFATSERMDDAGRMPIQRGDGSGSWTDEQNRLTARLR